ncbi:MAG: hypothetical protein IPI76_05370 [Chloracidobacterium sp.]|nr:hypothetical protein [Chloracidobacterium sp.]
MEEPRIGVGTYPPAEVGLGGNTSVVPDGPPVGALRLIAYTNTNFKGTLEADPVTGVVRVTNAHPIGVYPITLVSTESSGASSTAFALTVTNVTSCSNAALGAVANTTVGNGPRSAVPADFNRDGKQDLVAANFNGDNVSIALGWQRRSFHQLELPRDRGKPISVAVG